MDIKKDLLQKNFQKLLSMPVTPNRANHSRHKSMGFGSNFDVSQYTVSSKAGSDNSMASSRKYEEELTALDWSKDVKITKDHNRIYNVCNKYNKDMAKVHFDFIASNYEGMYQRMGWPDPKMCAKMVNKYMMKHEMNPSDVSVLDYACGTGLVGQYLSEYGIKNIDGVDISPNMLEEASEKCVYRDLTEHTLGENPDDLP